MKVKNIHPGHLDVVISDIIGQRGRLVWNETIDYVETDEILKSYTSGGIKILIDGSYLQRIAAAVDVTDGVDVEDIEDLADSVNTLDGASHAQNTDTKLDEGGGNEVDAAGVKDAVDLKHDGTVQAAKTTAVTATDSAVTAAADGDTSVAEANADADASVTADAPDQTAGYVEADVDAIATLANDLKAKYNDAVTLLNSLKGNYNDLAGKYDDVVTLANDLKAKYNDAVTLINELKGKLDTMNS